MGYCASYEVSSWKFGWSREELATLAVEASDGTLICSPLKSHLALFLLPKNMLMTRQD